MLFANTEKKEGDVLIFISDTDPQSDCPGNLARPADQQNQNGENAGAKKAVSNKSSTAAD